MDSARPALHSGLHEKIGGNRKECDRYEFGGVVEQISMHRERFHANRGENRHSRNLSSKQGSKGLMGERQRNAQQHASRHPSRKVVVPAEDETRRQEGI